MLYATIGYDPAVRRGLIKFILLTQLIACPVVGFRAIDGFRNPSRFPVSAWSRHWYDDLIQAIYSAVIVGACLSYDYRRTVQERHDPSIAKLSYTQWAPAWRQRKELRLLLYTIAIMGLLDLPLAMLKATEAVNSSKRFRNQYPGYSIPEWNESFWSVFDFDDGIAVCFGIGLIIYDQRRLKNDILLHPGHCRYCGYDLRASPERCPERGRERSSDSGKSEIMK